MPCSYSCIMNKMLIKFDDGTPISLEQMLLAKEKRVENQLLAISLYKKPLVSLTLVIPGPIKNSSGANYIFQEAITALHQFFIKNDIPLIKKQHYHELTGYEAILVVDCAIEKLKQYCIDIESQHPLGRLWDIDVIDPITQKSVSRSQFEYAPRQCLVCEDIAKICGRSKRHSLDEIFVAIKEKIENFQKNKS